MRNIAIILCALSVTATAIAESRIWTSTNGHTVEADYVSQTATNVKLKRLLDDAVLDVPISSLSKADQQFLTSLKSAPIPAPKASSAGSKDDFIITKNKALISLARQNVELSLTDRADQRFNISMIDLMKHAGDRTSPWHGPAFKTARQSPALLQALTKIRTDFENLPRQTDADAFLSQSLDPVIKGMTSPRSDTLIDDFARLHKALHPEKNGIEPMAPKP